MSKPMVPRHYARYTVEQPTGEDSHLAVVTDSDARKLEAALEAANRLALELGPYPLDGEVTKCACCGGEWMTANTQELGGNHQRLCAWSAFDAAMKELEQ